MKKQNHPIWPQPFLGMEPIRLRPMGWLDDLLPMRPPSLWRDISYGNKGLRWSPDMADLAWLFAAYSMLGVELPAPRIQHISHVSQRTPKRRRTNARTLLQQKGKRGKQIAIPNWSNKSTMPVLAKTASETAPTSPIHHQRKRTISASTLPNFQWKKNAQIQRPGVESDSSRQFVQRLVQEQTIFSPKKQREEQRNITVPSLKKDSETLSARKIQKIRYIEPTEERNKRTRMVAPYQQQSVFVSKPRTEEQRTLGQKSKTITIPSVVEQQTKKQRPSSQEKTWLRKTEITKSIPIRMPKRRGSVSPEQRVQKSMNQRSLSEPIIARKKSFVVAKEISLRLPQQTDVVQEPTIAKKPQQIQAPLLQPISKKYQKAAEAFLVTKRRIEQQEEATRIATQKREQEQIEQVRTKKKLVQQADDNILRIRNVRNISQEEKRQRRFSIKEQRIVAPFQIAFREENRSLFKHAKTPQIREQAENVRKQKRQDQETVQFQKRKVVFSPIAEVSKRVKTPSAIFYTAEQNRVRQIVWPTLERQKTLRSGEKPLVLRLPTAVQNIVQPSTQTLLSPKPETTPATTRQVHVPPIAAKTVTEKQSTIQQVRIPQRATWRRKPQPKVVVSKGKKQSFVQENISTEAKRTIVPSINEQSILLLSNNKIGLEATAKKTRELQKQEETVVQKKKQIPAMVSWPQQTRTQLLQHFEIKRRKAQRIREEQALAIAKAKEDQAFIEGEYRTKKRESIFSEESKKKQVKREVLSFVQGHNFFSRAQNELQKERRSPLTMISAGTLVFPTPQNNVSEEEQGFKKKKQAEEAQNIVVNKKQSIEYPKQYTQKRTSYRRAFANIEKLVKKLPANIQQSITPRLGSLFQKLSEDSGFRGTSIPWIEVEQPLPKESTSVTKREKRKYRGLGREAAVFWTRSKSVTTQMPVLTGIKKQQTVERELAKPKKISIPSKELRIPKRQTTKMPFGVDTSTQRRISATEDIPHLSSQKYRAEQKQDSRKRLKPAVSFAPIQTWQKAPFIRDPFVEQARMKRGEIENHRWVKPKSISANLVVQPTIITSPKRAQEVPDGKIVRVPSLAEKTETIQSKKIAASQNRVESNKKKARTIEQAQENRKIRRDAMQSPLVRKRSTSYLRAAQTIPSRFLSSTMKFESLAKQRQTVKASEQSQPISVKKSEFLENTSKERQIQWYREASQQTFLRPEAVNLDLEKIEGKKSTAQPKSAFIRSETTKEQTLANKRIKKTAAQKTFQAMRQVTQQARQKKQQVWAAESQQRVFVSKQETSEAFATRPQSYRTSRTTANFAKQNGGISAPMTSQKIQAVPLVAQELVQKKPLSQKEISIDARAVKGQNTQSAETVRKQTATTSKTEKIGQPKKPKRLQRSSFLSRNQTHFRRSFPKLAQLAKRVSSVEEEQLFAQLTKEAEQDIQEAKSQIVSAEQQIQVIKKKKKIASGRPLIPTIANTGRATNVFLRPKKVVVEEEEVQKPRREIQHPDSVNTSSDVFLIDPSGNLLTGQKATKRLEEMGYARKEKTSPQAEEPQQISSGNSFTWEASPELLAEAVSQVKKEVHKEEQPQKIKKKKEPRRVMTEMTEKELFLILSELATSSPAAQELLRDVRLKVEEYFDYEKFRKI